MDRRRPVGRAACFALVACAVLLPLIAFGRPVGAQTEGSFIYDAVAGSSAVRVGVGIDNFLLISQLVDVGGATAQSMLDAVGNSDAYAAYPYPGEVAASKSPPFIAHSSSPTQPDAKADAWGVYTLVAHSEPEASSATAHGGIKNGDQTAGRSEAASSVAHDADHVSVVAEAHATAEALNFGEVLRIGRVYSQAQVTAIAGEQPEPVSKLEVADMTVAGQRVVLTPAGLSLPGSTVPLDQGSPVLKVLADNDLDVRYLAPELEPGSVVSAGVAITAKRDVPGVGKAIVTYTLGRSSAAARIEGSGGSVDALSGGAGDAGGGAGLASSPTDAGYGSAGSSATGGFADVAAGPVGTASSPSKLARPASSPSGSDSVSLGATRAAAAQPVGGSSLVGFYLILVVAGALALGGGQLIRILGVRFAWTS